MLKSMSTHSYRLVNNLIVFHPQSFFKLFSELHSEMADIHVAIQGFPKLTKSCSRFPKILLINADQGTNGKIGYLVWGLVAKVKDTVANG